jgi:hypothetical protein
MSEKLNTVIIVIGIDIGKNSFHVVGLDKRGAIVLRQKWSRGQVENTARQHSALPDRHGSLRRCASSQSQAQDAWSGRRAQIVVSSIGGFRTPARPGGRHSAHQGDELPPF